MARQGVGNLEAIELGLREALFKDGRRLLEALYAQPYLSIPTMSAAPEKSVIPTACCKCIRSSVR